MKTVLEISRDNVGDYFYHEDEPEYEFEKDSIAYDIVEDAMNAILPTFALNDVNNFNYDDDEGGLLRHDLDYTPYKELMINLGYYEILRNCDYDEYSRCYTDNDLCKSMFFHMKSDIEDFMKDYINLYFTEFDHNLENKNVDFDDDEKMREIEYHFNDFKPNNIDISEIKAEIRTFLKQKKIQLL